MSLFSKLVKDRREKLGWSQNKLALQSGVSQQLVWRIENNGGCMVKTASKIARALGMDAIPLED